MNVLIASTNVIPAFKYGGTERVIWGLGRELVNLGHRVQFLVQAGSSCPFADVLTLAEDRPLDEQIPDDTDIVHFHFTPWCYVSKPHMATVHGNASDSTPFPINSVFISRDHAKRHGSEAFVYNGLDWDDYTAPDWSSVRSGFHFLGKAAWRKKNVQGAIRIARRAGVKLNVMGGTRLNFNMGFRFTPWPSIRFSGMVGGIEKHRMLNESKGLIFPIRWHEPFGLALIESMFYGCPVFGTPYGSLPELVPQDVGVLSTRISELVEAVQNVDEFKASVCHEYARDLFGSDKMTASYLANYEAVLNGHQLNETEPQLVKIQQEKFLPLED